MANSKIVKLITESDKFEQLVLDHNKNNENTTVIEILGAPAAGKSTLYELLKSDYKCRDEPIKHWLQLDLFNKTKNSEYDIQLQIILDLIFNDKTKYDFVFSHFIATWAHTKLKYKQNQISKTEFDLLETHIFKKLNIKNHKCIILMAENPAVYLQRMAQRDKYYDRSNRKAAYPTSLNELFLEIAKENDIPHKIINCDRNIEEIITDVKSELSKYLINLNS